MKRKQPITQFLDITDIYPGLIAPFVSKRRKRAKWAWVDEAVWVLVPIDPAKVITVKEK